jgi:hypothetical protein
MLTLVNTSKSVKIIEISDRKKKFPDVMGVSKAKITNFTRQQRKLTPSDSITEQIAAYEKIVTIIHCFISLTVFSQDKKRPKRFRF